MTIDEMIERAEDIARLFESGVMTRRYPDAERGAKDYKQLAEWLKDCKTYQEAWKSIKEQIDDEQEFAYADFNQYKIDVLNVDTEYVDDELPQDDYRFGMKRCLEIIDEHLRR